MFPKLSSLTWKKTCYFHGPHLGSISTSSSTLAPIIEQPENFWSESFSASAKLSAKLFPLLSTDCMEHINWWSCTSIYLTSLTSIVIFFRIGITLQYLILSISPTLMSFFDLNYGPVQNAFFRFEILQKIHFWNLTKPCFVRCFLNKFAYLMTVVKFFNYFRRK